MSLRLASERLSEALQDTQGSIERAGASRTSARGFRRRRLRRFAAWHVLAAIRASARGIAYAGTPSFDLDRAAAGSVSDHLFYRLNFIHLTLCDGSSYVAGAEHSTEAHLDATSTPKLPQ